MPETYKVLAQTNPTAANLTDSYTVGASRSAVVSTIVIANRSSVATAYRVSIAVAGAGDDVKQYIAYDTPITGNDTIAMTLGISLATTDVIRVYATLATLSFNIFGVEIT